MRSTIAEEGTQRPSKSRALLGAIPFSVQ